MDGVYEGRDGCGGSGRREGGEGGGRGGGVDGAGEGKEGEGEELFWSKEASAPTTGRQCRR